MRRMFSSRSSFPNPSPLERCVRTTSPSRTSTLAPRARSRSASRPESVLLPAPDIPVNHNVHPLCVLATGLRPVGIFGSVGHREMNPFFFQSPTYFLCGQRSLDAQEVRGPNKIARTLPQFGVGCNRG